MGFFFSVYPYDLNFFLPVFARHILISKEVMFQTINHNMGQFTDIVVTVIRSIVPQYRNNFVVCLITVEHTETSDRSYPGDNIAMSDRPFSQDTNIQRIAVSDNLGTVRLLHTVFCHQIPAVTLRNKTV